MPVESPPVTFIHSSSRTQKAFKAECVEFFAEAVQLFGVPKSVGQIYGLLYASPLALSFSDIVEQLKISKGSASQGLQLLRALGAINVASHKLKPTRDAKDGRQAHGTIDALTPEVSRREYFEPELSLRKLLGGVLRERIAPLAATSTERLAYLRDLAEQDTGKNDFYLDRARQLETWRRRLKSVLPLLGALLGKKTNS